jgi:hypothetical protein
MVGANSSASTVMLEEQFSSTQTEERVERFPEVAIPSPRDAVDMESLPGQIVRQKEHAAKPMSIDDALSHMELVGHDFYLFSCQDTGLPSVVYRRKGYDYGVIRLA